MATILEARGRMTKDLVTAFEIGQEVVLVSPDADSRAKGLRAGDTGVVRKIVISDPNDGDSTFPMIYARFGTLTTLFGTSEIAPATEAEAYQWARRQIDALGGAR